MFFFKDSATTVNYTYSTTLSLHVSLPFCNGASFYNVSLASLDRTFGRKVPWPHTADRCFRTLKAIGKANDVKPPPFLGVPHNALDDALHQAEIGRAHV